MCFPRLMTILRSNLLYWSVVFQINIFSAPMESKRFLKPEKTRDHLGQTPYLSMGEQILDDLAKLFSFVESKIRTQTHLNSLFTTPCFLLKEKKNVSYSKTDAVYLKKHPIYIIFSHFAILIHCGGHFLIGLFIWTY